MRNEISRRNRTKDTKKKGTRLIAKNFFTLLFS
jgi:hypothetical protein